MIFSAKSYLVTQTVGNNLVRLAYLTRSAFACSKQQWKHQKISEICSKLTIKTRTTSLTCIYCSLWTDFTQCFGVSIVDFEQVNAGWGTETYLEPCQTFMMESRYFYPLTIFTKKLHHRCLAGGLDTALLVDPIYPGLSWICTREKRWVYYANPSLNNIENFLIQIRLRLERDYFFIWHLH